MKPLEQKFGNCLDLLPSIPNCSADCCLTDPPYGDTSLEWDTKVDGWLTEVARILKPNASIWIFGSMRFLAPLFAEFAALDFKYSQDIVWEKQNGTGFHADRFRRVHEHAVLFYRGAWADVYHDTQYTPDAIAKTVRRKTKPTHIRHTGIRNDSHYTSEDGGPRMMRSVIYMPNEHGHAIHPTQKPVDLIRPLIRYSVPPGGVVLDPFMGSASIGVAAHLEGRGYIGMESDGVHYADAVQRVDEILNPPVLPQMNLFSEAA